MKIENDELIFRSGRKVTASLGIVGIALSDDGMFELHEGRDGSIITLFSGGYDENPLN